MYAGEGVGRTWCDAEYADFPLAMGMTWCEERRERGKEERSLAERGVMSVEKRSRERQARAWAEAASAAAVAAAAAAAAAAEISS